MSIPTSYAEFLSAKAHLIGEFGFEATWVPDSAFDFQRELIAWSIAKGRAAIFADCGLGKTLILLAWAENVARHTDGRILILTPLAVSYQTVSEGEKFGIEVVHRREGIEKSDRIVVTNYERLHYFDPNDFAGVVCDESGILKNFAGQRKRAITDFMLKRPYRLLCTATAAPNDYIELGTSSEALGHLGYIDMLKMFFKAADGSYSQGGAGGRSRRFDSVFDGKFRFRGHAEHDFWRWVCSWARAMRRPSDLGFDDGAFALPSLTVRDHLVTARTKREGLLFDMPAVTLQEQREESRRTLAERCETAAEIANGHGEPFVAWCHLNAEGDLLTKLIDGAVQVCGSDAEEKKERIFRDFQDGNVRAIVTKPKIAGFGLNWQHCAHMTYFPSHSYEQYYQSVRRCWRFGQPSPVTVDVISTEGQERVKANLQRKAGAASEMFDNLVGLMRNELKVVRTEDYTDAEEVPSWL